MQQRASAMDEVAARRRRHERDAAAAWTRQRERDGRQPSAPRPPTRGRGADGHRRPRRNPPRRDPPLVDRRTVPRGGAFAPTQQYAAPAAAPAVVDAAPAAAAVAEEPVAAPLVRKTPIGADLFTQLGGVPRPARRHGGAVVQRADGVRRRLGRRLPAPGAPGVLRAVELTTFLGRMGAHSRTWALSMSAPSFADASGGTCGTASFA